MLHVLRRWEESGNRARHRNVVETTTTCEELATKRGKRSMWNVTWNRSSKEPNKRVEKSMG